MRGLDPSASGPYRFVSWQKGEQITIAKNTAYKAGPTTKLDRVIFRYIPDTQRRSRRFGRVRSRSTEPQSQLQIEDFLKDPKFAVQAGAGYFYEHIDIQFGAKGHPALKQPYVRQAIITGINRPQIGRRSTRRIAPGLPSLQSHIFKPFETTYKSTSRSTRSARRRSSAC